MITLKIGTTESMTDEDGQKISINEEENEILNRYTTIGRNFCKLDLGK